MSTNTRPTRSKKDPRKAILAEAVLLPFTGFDPKKGQDDVSAKSKKDRLEQKLKSLVNHQALVRSNIANTTPITPSTDLEPPPTSLPPSSAADVPPRIYESLSTPAPHHSNDTPPFTSDAIIGPHNTSTRTSLLHAIHSLQDPEVTRLPNGNKYATPTEVALVIRQFQAAEAYEKIAKGRRRELRRELERCGDEVGVAETTVAVTGPAVPEANASIAAGAGIVAPTYSAMHAPPPPSSTRPTRPRVTIATSDPRIRSRNIAASPSSASVSGASPGNSRRQSIESGEWTDAGADVSPGTPMEGVMFAVTPTTTATPVAPVAPMVPSIASRPADFAADAASSGGRNRAVDGQRRMSSGPAAQVDASRDPRRRL